MFVRLNHTDKSSFKVKRLPPRSLWSWSKNQWSPEKRKRQGSTELGVFDPWPRINDPQRSKRGQVPPGDPWSEYSGSWSTSPQASQQGSIGRQGSVDCHLLSFFSEKFTWPRRLRLNKIIDFLPACLTALRRGFVEHGPARAVNPLVISAHLQILLNWIIFKDQQYLCLAQLSIHVFE